MSKEKLKARLRLKPSLQPRERKERLRFVKIVLQ
jgi:hypothetical protein